MNSMELIQACVTRWLNLPGGAAMGASEMQDALMSINSAMFSVWRSLPEHYRRQHVSMDFYAPAAGLVTVAGTGQRSISGLAFPSIQDLLTFQGDPLFFNGEPLLFNGSPVYESPRPYCSIDIQGDRRNTLEGGISLRNPYMGVGSGELQAVLYHDAALSPVVIDQVISPLVDGATLTPYYQVPRHVPGYGEAEGWTMRRIQHEGVTRTLLELVPGHARIVVLEFDAFVTPSGLTLGSSMRPVDLPFDAEVGGYIVASCGAWLSRHRLFDSVRHTPAGAAEAARIAMSGLSSIPGQISTYPNTVGTEFGY